MAIYEKLFQRVGVGWGGGGAVHFGLYTQTDVGGGRGVAILSALGYIRKL